MKLLELIGRVILGLLFLYSGINKIVAPQSFAETIHNFRLAPQWAEMALAYWLPWMETLCGLALLTRIGYSGALMNLSIMLFGFTTVLVSAMLRGLDVSCGCFGPDSASWPNWLAVLRNCLLLAIVFGLVKSQMLRRQPRPKDEGTPLN